MRIKYDAEVDVLMIYLRDGKYEESNEVAHNVIMDVDDKGMPMTIEILDATRTLGIDLTFTVELPVMLPHTQSPGAKSD